MELHAAYSCDSNDEAKVKCRFCNQSFTKQTYVDTHVRECNDLLNLLKRADRDQMRASQLQSQLDGAL